MRARSAAAVAALLVVGMVPASFPTVQADGPGDEQQFIVAAQDLPYYVLPDGHDSTPAGILAGGYRACSLLDQYPTDPLRAERIYYNGGNTIDGEITYDGVMFFLYATLFLCERHAQLYENI